GDASRAARRHLVTGCEVDQLPRVGDAPQHLRLQPAEEVDLREHPTDVLAVCHGPSPRLGARPDMAETSRGGGCPRLCGATLGRVHVSLLGVRGSTPAPGPEFVRYGGHTSCVAIAADGATKPTLVLDAGTGLRSLTQRLDGGAFRGSVVVSHLHWDHVEGLPFFVAGDRPDAEVHLYLPAQGGRSARHLLATTMSPPCFPITPEGLQGTWTFHALDA